MVLVENPLFAQNRDKLIQNRQEIKPFFLKFLSWDFLILCMKLELRDYSNYRIFLCHEVKEPWILKIQNIAFVEFSLLKIKPSPTWRWLVWIFTKRWMYFMNFLYFIKQRCFCNLFLILCPCLWCLGFIEECRGFLMLYVNHGVPVKIGFLNIFCNLERTRSSSFSKA